MKKRVLIDTNIWSEVFRKNNQSDCENEVIEIIESSRIVMIGPIRQELLSGIKTNRQYQNMKGKLRAFKDFPISTSHYEKAALFYNICRSKGVQGSFIDFLICAVAENENLEIFTKDKDFNQYAKHINIHLYQKIK